MPRPRKITEEMRAEIIEVGRRRKELRTLPTTKELAQRAGCSTRAVQDAMYGRSNVRSSEVSRVTEAELDELADEIAESVLRGTFNDEKKAEE